MMYFCPVCDIEEWPAGVGCDHAVITQPVKLMPCPFCKGPPSPTHRVRRIAAARTLFVRWLQHLRLKRQLLLVEAYVFCHECGARSCKIDYFPDNQVELQKLLSVLMARAVLEWNTRNERHHDLYVANALQGHDFYPRENAGNG